MSVVAPSFFFSFSSKGFVFVSFVASFPVLPPFSTALRLAGFRLFPSYGKN